MLQVFQYGLLCERLLCDGGGARAAHAKTPRHTALSPMRVDSVGSARICPPTWQLACSRQWRNIEKAMAGGCARPGSNGCRRRARVPDSVKHEARRGREDLSMQAMQRTSVHRLICGAETGAWSSRLCHQVTNTSEHKNKPPSIRPSLLLASPPTVLAPIALSGPLSLHRHPS